MDTNQQKYNAACKLMLFGEYLVLRGSKSLAFPLKFGQELEVRRSNQLKWASYSPEGCWFEAEFSSDFKVTSTNHPEASEILAKLFRLIADIHPQIDWNLSFKATADFNLSWGLGSSSTLISLLSQWSNCDPYQLLDVSFGGSGYDVACATAQGPIVYEMPSRSTKEVSLHPKVTEKLLFVYLGEKQNSRNEIKRFEKNEVTPNDIQQLNEIIDKSIKTDTIEAFESLIDQSEMLLSPIIGKERLKDHIFADYTDSIKSLGAWGGDFFLATFRDLEKAKTYFNSKGMKTMFTYKELIKQ